MEPLATCETNKKCLLSLVEALRTQASQMNVDKEVQVVQGEGGLHKRISVSFANNYDWIVNVCKISS